MTRNTLAGASLKPTITSALGKGTSKASGDVLTRAKQSYVIEGYVNTPGGRVRTRVEQSLSFANTQRFAAAEGQGNRHVTEQSAHAESSSSSTGGSSTGRNFQRSLDYSLTVDVLRSNHESSRTHTVHLQQNFVKRIEQREAALPPY